MVRVMVSRVGLILSLCFSIYAIFFLFLAFRGAWQAPIFISIAVLPFSIGVDYFWDFAQAMWEIQNLTRSWLESISTSFVGIFEFYVIGWILESIYKNKGGVN